jgi:hypothetical protein
VLDAIDPRPSALRQFVLPFAVWRARSQEGMTEWNAEVGVSGTSRTGASGILRCAPE